MKDSRYFWCHFISFPLTKQVNSFERMPKKENPLILNPNYCKISWNCFNSSAYTKDLPNIYEGLILSDREIDHKAYTSYIGSLFNCFDALINFSCFNVASVLQFSTQCPLLRLLRDLTLVANPFREKLEHD